MALEGPSLAARLFYSLYDPKKLSEYKAVYADPPEQWHPILHPLFQEAEKTDELSVWTKSLYGTETLGNVLLARDTTIRLFSCTKSDYTVHKILDNLWSTVIERVLAHKLFSFIVEGKVRILCLICLFRIKNKKVEPVLLTCSQFIYHYANDHGRNVNAQSLAFATGLHQRYFESAALYFFAVGNGANGIENPDEHPFEESSPPFVKMGTDNCLKSFVSNLTQEQLKSRKLSPEPDLIIDSDSKSSPSNDCGALIL
jgi:hypothetical protein